MKSSTFGAAFIAAWVAIIAATLAFYLGVGVIAWHFIQKWW